MPTTSGATYAKLSTRKNWRRHLFFALAIENRSSDLLVREIARLRRAYRYVQQTRPFKTLSICVLPDHLHAIWSLPADDCDFAGRWNLINGGFSRGLPAALSTPSKKRKREKGIWQRCYWEHVIRDGEDLARHIAYIHFNPVKHGLVPRASDWPHSSFHQFVKRGDLPADWGGDTHDTPNETFGE